MINRIRWFWWVLSTFWMRDLLDVLLITLFVVMAALATTQTMKSYAETHTFSQSRYCWEWTSTTEKGPFWNDPIVDQLCMYANPFDSRYTDGTTMVNGSFGLAQFVVDLFPTKDRWSDTFGAQKYRARAVFVTEDWQPFGPQWGVELVYNIGIPDRGIEEGWTLKIGNTTGGKGFETYTGLDGNCYIREIPDDRVIQIFIPTSKNHGIGNGGNGGNDR